MKKGFIYILQSEKNGKFYLGASYDPHKRVLEHNNGRTSSTQSDRPWVLKFYQRYGTIKEAKQMEYKLKQFKSRKILEQIIAEGHVSANI